MGAPLKIPSSLDRLGAVVALGIFAAIFLGAGLAMGYFLYLRPMLQVRAAQAWVETPCRILFSGVGVQAGEKGDTYCVVITYQYEAAGQTYQAIKYDFTEGYTSNRARCDEAVRLNPVGRQTVCYVNPQNPSEAVVSRSFANTPGILAGSGVFSLVGLGMMLPMVNRVRRRFKFGQSTFELMEAPAPIGGVLEGTVTFARMLQPRDGFAVKLSCIHRVDSGGQHSSVRETPLWKNKKQVTSDIGGSMTISFALPEDAAETSAVNRNDRIFWRLDVTGSVPEGKYQAQFEVPVAQAELSAAERAEARQLRSEEAQEVERFQLPAHSRIRVRDIGGGKEFYFPAMRNLGMIIMMTLFISFWTGVCWVLFHYHAPLIFPVVFGFFEAVLLYFWFNTCFGSSRVVAGNGEIILSKHLLGLGRSQTIPASEIREIKISVGATMGTQAYYNVQLVRQNGMTQTAGAEVADSQEAHWLALEMARCAGVGR